MRLFRRILAATLAIALLCNTFCVTVSADDTTIESAITAVDPLADVIDSNAAESTAPSADAEESDAGQSTTESAADTTVPGEGATPEADGSSESKNELESSADTIPEITPETAETAEAADTEQSEQGKAEIESMGLYALMLLEAAGEYPITTAQQLKGLVSTATVEDEKIKSITINGAQALIYLSLTKPELYQNAVITLATAAPGDSIITQDVSVQIGSVSYSFQGLGSETAPFAGELKASAGGFERFHIDRALFRGLSTSAKATDLSKDNFVIDWQGVQDSPVFADVVVEAKGESQENPTNWNFTFYNYDSTEGSYRAFQGMVGKITVASEGEGEVIPFQIKVDFTAHTPEGEEVYKRKVVQVDGEEHAGLLCRMLGEKAVLDATGVTLPTDGYTVTAASGNAGGLVGDMAANATLQLATVTMPESMVVTATNGDAGGLVGKMAANAVLQTTGNVTLHACTVQGKTTAGGLVGMANTPTLSWAGTPSVQVSASTIQGATNCGGLFGSYYNNDNSNKFVIDNTYSATDNIISPSGSGNAGGLFGLYTASALSNTLCVQSTTDTLLSISSTLSSNAACYGGVAGQLGEETAYPSYAEIEAVSVKAEAKDRTVTTGYGGLFGTLGESSALTANDIILYGNFAAATADGSGSGGVVGKLNKKAVLRLVTSANLSGMTPQTGSSRYGQIVGVQDNSLVYAKSGWAGNFTRPAADALDDIGNYGEVIRLDGALSDLITWNESNHCATVAAQTGYASANDTFTLGTPAQFAALAIVLQTKGVYNGFTDFTYNDTINSTIELSNTIDMSGTGIQGLMRDDGSQTYTGTFDGQNDTLTLDIGKPYGKGVDQTLPETGIGTAGRGQMYQHKYLGLFGKLGSNATVKNLTLDGEVRFYAAGTTMGGVAASATESNITLTKLTTQQTIRIAGDSGGNVGGLLGCSDMTAKENQTLTMTNCTGSAKISYSVAKGDLYVGGLIGKVQQKGTNSLALKFTDNILQGEIIQSNTDLERARVGGLVSTITKDGSGKITLNLTNTIVSGQKITANAKTTSGGLLGYEWQDTEATLTNVVVKENATVTMNNTAADSANFGGLVYEASGHWILEKGTDPSTYGVDVQSAVFIGYANRTGVTDGLLVCKGYVSNQRALYLEVHDGAYRIDSDSVTVTENKATRFDELVGVTMAVSSGVPDYGNDQGIVSFSTGSTDGEMQDKVGKYSSYTNQLSNSGTNPYARYYYNLDEMSLPQDLSDGVVDSASELMAWSLYQYAASNLKAYFAAPLSNGSYTIKGTLDLTGYSYYPVDNTCANVGVMGGDSNATTLTFDNVYVATNETAESATKPRITSATNIKANTTTATQHFGMQCGLFRNQNSNLTVQNLTLKGNVGQWGTGSGAILCDTFTGTTTGTMSLTLADIRLQNIYVNGYTSGNSALLVQSACTAAAYGYSKITLQNIRTTGSYNDLAAAGSLLGDIGNINARQITLSFSQMQLDGRKTAGSGIAAYGNTTKSIFANATFLYSFRYAAECSGTYNFTQAEDWASDSDHSQKVTYGAEIITSHKNPNGQKQYFDNDIYTHPTEYGATVEYADFKTEYLPYVAQTQITNTDLTTNYEIDVNVKSYDIVTGCGTYGDPYQIKDYNQLKTLANYLSGINVDGWTIAYNADKVFCNQDRNDENPEKHVYYQSNAEGKWYPATKDSGNKFTADTSKASVASVNRDTMVNYLRNAYYEIVTDISMQSDFSGLGTDTTAFMGVIVGKTDGVTLSYSAPVAITARNGVGQLIGVSYGSVVKDLKIVYNNDAPITITQSDSPDKTRNRYFGAVMGDVKGGDNVIDNVTVTYNADNAIALSGTYSYAATVGGYVGLVESGGVIFKNMPNGNGLAALKGDSYKGYYYANPIVGRVLDAFVIYEQGEATNAETLDNSDKNYTIHTMTGNTSDLIVTGTPKNGTYTGLITVANAEGLFVLSAIVNSGAGAHSGKTSETSYGYAAYSIGKVRCSDYSTVGNVNNATEDSNYKTAVNSDDVYCSAISNDIGVKQSYLVVNYTNTATNDTPKLASTLTGTYTRFTLDLRSDCDMSTYGNGFRGISGRYPLSTERNTLYLHGFTGNDHKITVQMQENAYNEDAYRSKSVGLFTTLGTSDATTPTTGTIDITKLTLKGAVEYRVYDSSTNTAENTTFVGGNTMGTGGFLGTVTGGFSLKFSDVVLNNFTVRGTNYAGGLVGYTNQDITLTDCQYDTITVDARYSAGGLVGYNGTSGKTIAIYATKPLTLTTARITRNQNNSASNGAGGIIGASMGNLYVNNESDHNSINTITLQNLRIKSAFMGSGTNTTAVGGLVGSVKVSNIQYVNVVNATLDSLKLAISSDKYYGENTEGNNPYALKDPYKINDTENGKGWNSNNSAGGVVGNAAGDTTLSNVNVYATENDSFNIYSGANGGALVARHSGGSLTVENCKVSDGDDSSATYGALILYSVSRVGGVVGYDGTENNANASIKISNTVVGNPNATTQFIARVGTKDGYCGGLIGGSNSGTKNGTTIDGCLVQNTNILALMNAGGLVGKSFESYTIRNTTVKDSHIVTCNSAYMAGGLIGDMGKPLTGYNLLWSNNLIGYYIGKSTNKQPTVPTSSSEMSFDENTIAVKTGTSFTAYANLANIKEAKDLNNYTGAGTWVGKSNSEVINLLGVSRQSTDGYVPPLDVGDLTDYNGSIIYADYTGKATGETAYMPAGAASPYVTVNPTVHADTTNNIAANDVMLYDETGAKGTLLTGDGVMLQKDLAGNYTTGVAKTIWQAYNSASTQGKINTVYSGASAGADKGYTISHFNDEALSNTRATNIDIPVLIIDSTDRETVWETIKDTLDALTNGGYTKACGSNSGIAVDYAVDRYKLVEEGENQKYQLNKEKDASITLTLNNEYGYLFNVTSGRYDNYGENSFTLLTVTFTSGDSSFAVKLPIMVKRVVDIHFAAQAQNGTVFSKSQYGQSDSASAILSDYGEKTTTLLTYTYNYNGGIAGKTEGNYNWEEDINSGGNFLWYYSKTLSLGQSSESKMLASGSQITLIDLNQQNKAYATTLNSATNDLDLLNIFEDDWKPQYMCDLLELSAESDTTGNMVQLGAPQDGSLEPPSGATVRIKQGDGQYQYYRSRADGETGTHKITVAKKMPTEEYYLIIKPATQTGISKLNVHLPGKSLSVPESMSNKNLGLPNTLSTTEKAAINVIASLPQALTYTGNPSSSYNQLSPDGGTISFTLKDEIKIDAATLTFLTQQSERYLKFTLEPAIYQQNGTSIPESFKTGTLSVKFKLLDSDNNEISGGNGTYSKTWLDGTGRIDLPYENTDGMINLCQFVNSSTNRGEITVVAEVEMRFPGESMDMFPAYSAAKIEDNNGFPESYLQLIPKANLASNKNNLNGGTEEKASTVNHGFYCQKTNEAILHYDPIGDVSQLGINPSDAADMAESKIINTEGIYDLSALSDLDQIWDSTTALVCELRLYKKNSGTTYALVDTPESYLNSVTARAGNTELIANGACYTWQPSMDDLRNMTYKRVGQETEQHCFSTDGLFQLPFDLVINANETDFANYKVELTVKLLRSENEDELVKTDYFKYTFAKISTTLLTPAN